jgi:hypothetical protein
LLPHRRAHLHCPQPTCHQQGSSPGSDLQKGQEAAAEVQREAEAQGDRQGMGYE